MHCCSRLPLVCWAGESAASKLSADKPNLVVMTFNIRYGTANDGENNWDNRKDMACDVLRRHNPDVVGLQEALRSQIDDIRAALPQYAEIGVGRDDGKTKGEYSAILYRKDRLDVDDSGTFWLSDTPETPGSITWGNTCTRICTWGRFIPQGHRRSLLPVQHAPGPHLAVLAGSRRDPAGPADPRPQAPGPRPPHGRLQRRRGQLRRAVLQGRAANCRSPTTACRRIPSRWWTRSACCTPTPRRSGHSTASRAAARAPRSTTSSPSRARKCSKAEILRDNKDNRYPSDHFPVLAALRFAAQSAN